MWVPITVVILLTSVPVHARYFTDPACPASWGIEPALRKLVLEFGGNLDFTYVMGGLARDFSKADRLRLVYDWLDYGERSGMPVDPRLWREGPLGSSFPACMAVKAAGEQGRDGELLRALREGILCFRRKLDTAEALVEEARRVGLDVERFRIDLGSNAIVELFAGDIEEARAVPEEARTAGVVVERQGKERVPLPTVAFVAADGTRHWVFDQAPYERYRDAALAAGAQPGGETLDVEGALRRFGRMATAEVEAVCGLPTPRAAAELWRLVGEWKAKPTQTLTGWFFEPA